MRTTVMHSGKCVGKFVVLGEAWERQSVFECRAYQRVRLLAHWVSASITTFWMYTGAQVWGTGLYLEEQFCICVYVRSSFLQDFEWVLRSEVMCVVWGLWGLRARGSDSTRTLLGGYNKYMWRSFGTMGGTWERNFAFDWGTWERIRTNVL